MSAAAPAISAAFDRARDEETIRRLRETGHDGDPRTYLRECAGCPCPFWCPPTASHRRFCSERCRVRAFSEAQRRRAGCPVRVRRAAA